MIPLVYESPLLRAAGFRHGFTSRLVNFRPPHSLVARESVALALRFDQARLFQVEQVHGDRALVIERGAAPKDVERERADALVTRDRGAAVGVRVADCVPLLLADARTGAVAAVHAGWRGVVRGVIASALRSIEPTVAVIGPCIGACCFEVGEDVAAQIGDAFVARRAGDKAWVDLRAAARAELPKGVFIDEIAGCTRCDAEQFFSHRRDADAAGRHLAVIVAP